LTYYILKLIITALLIVIISEVAKKSSLLGAILAAIPLVSILAMTWMYIDTNSSEKAVEFSNTIIWLIAPTMTLFLAFPILIKQGFNFYISLGISIFLTVLAYYTVILILNRFGMRG